jgi:hypothetical protein
MRIFIVLNFTATKNMGQGDMAYTNNCINLAANKIISFNLSTERQKPQSLLKFFLKR